MSSNNKNMLKDLANLARSRNEESGKKSKKRMNVNWKLVIVVLVYVTSLFVTAIKEFVSADMDIGYIMSSEFLSSMILNTINNWFILIAIFVYFLDKHIKSKKTKDTKDNIYNTVKKLKKSIFSLFLNMFNRERRKEKYKAILDKQLDGLEKNATQEDYLIYLKGTEEDKKNNEYCVKKKDLIERMDEKNLEKEIDEVYVKIKETTSNFVKYGYSRGGNGYRDPWETESGVWKFIRDLAPKLLLGLALLFGVQALVIEPAASVKWTAAFVAIVLRLYPIAVHTYIGIIYANQYYDEKILVDLGIREDIAEQAEEYQKNFEDGKIEVEERRITENPVIVYKGVGENG